MSILGSTKGFDMSKINYWINLVLGIILISISIFFGVVITIVLFGNTSVFGINAKILGLYIAGNDATSTIPIFIGLLSLSGALLLNQSLKSIRKFN